MGVGRIARRFGLSLAPEECAGLIRRRAEVLRETERIEFGEGVLSFKGACRERLGDDELIAAMTALFNGFAGGCPQRIADLDGAAMLRFAETRCVEEDYV